MRYQNNKLISISALVLFLFTTADAQALPRAAYKITVDEKQPKILHIKAKLALQNDSLYMHEDGAEQFPRRWAHFVRNLTAAGVTGNALGVEKLPDAKWKVKVPSDRQISLTYDVILDHETHTWPGGIDGVGLFTRIRHIRNRPHLPDNERPEHAEHPRFLPASGRLARDRPLGAESRK
jgi:hypothetical protein